MAKKSTTEIEPGGTPTTGDLMGGYNAVPEAAIRTNPNAPPTPVAKQGPNEQSILDSGMTVEEWQRKHPDMKLGPSASEAGLLEPDQPVDLEKVAPKPSEESTY